MSYQSRHWQDNGKCVSAPERDKEVFTGPYPTIEIARDINRRYCADCPVKTQCFNWAWEDWHFAGIAGGAIFSGEKDSTSKRHAKRIVPPAPRKSRAKKGAK